LLSEIKKQGQKEQGDGSPLPFSHQHSTNLTVTTASQ